MFSTACLVIYVEGLNMPLHHNVLKKKKKANIYIICNNIEIKKKFCKTNISATYNLEILEIPLNQISLSIIRQHFFFLHFLKKTVSSLLYVK